MSGTVTLVCPGCGAYLSWEYLNAHHIGDGEIRCSCGEEFFVIPLDPRVCKVKVYGLELI